MTSNDSSSPTDQPAPLAKPVLEYSSGLDPEDRGWVNLWIAQNPFEANLAVNKLDEEGIRARVDMENTTTLGSWGYTGPNGTKVQVIAADVERARAVLAEIDRKMADRRNRGLPKCPECGQLPPKSIVRPKRAAGVAVFLLIPILVGTLVGAEIPSPIPLLAAVAALGWSLYLLLSKALPRWRCPACAHGWEAAESEVVEDSEEDDSVDDDDSRDIR